MSRGVSWGAPGLGAGLRGGSFHFLVGRLPLASWGLGWGGTGA